eukprot:Tbor_TRINITY_DN5438_c0_g2::TRINITY_DN5438_c0_g2_i1::g.24251::m.24251/K14833/NOC2; nucleolar complex protein 2
MPPKVKKSFKKFATKHLAGVIERRRKTATSRKEMKERVEKKKIREKKLADNEEREHVEQLERLKELDPEFYSYLEEEDPTLLQFGQMDDEADLVGDDSGSDAETEADEGSERDEDDLDDDDDEEDKKAVIRISAQELKEALAGKKVDPILNIFLSAIRELGYTVKETPTNVSTRKFEDPSLVKNCLSKISRKIGESLPSLLKNGSFKSITAKVQVRRFLTALVSAVSQGSNDAVLVATLLQSIAPFVPVLHVLKGQTKNVLKTALNLCTHADEIIRLAAYTVVRAIATRAAGTRTMYQSSAFKGLFLAVVRTANHYNIHTLPVIGFLMSSVVDLYGSDIEAAYQHTFVYTRQLATHLRAALQQQSQANVRAVFNWQYLNALRTWGLVVSSYSEPAQLGPLIHPVVQISLGVMDLFSSPRMYPMHLHVLEMLNHITSRANGVYIPLTPYILRILTSPSLSLTSADKRGRDSGNIADKVDLQFCMRVKKSQFRSQDYKISVWKETLFLLLAHLAVHSTAIGFPEAFWPVESTLKKLRKDVKIPKIHSIISTILKHMESTSKKIIVKRDAANFGPSDMVSVKMFEDDLKREGNPLIQYHTSLREARLKEFADKQRNLGERVTIEGALEDQAVKKKHRAENKSVRR